MPAIVIVGAQWGDEGKGKAADLLGDDVDYVVRYQGGNNAGHTVVIGDESYALHLLPAGVLSRKATPVIGNGVVIDPAVLLEEIDGLQARGVSCDRLLISANAHLIMPHHIALDKVTERHLGNARIGTTGRGIGPTYSDKAGRMGIRVQDLLDPGILAQKLELVLREKNQVLTKVYNRRGIDAEATAQEYLGYFQRMQRYVADTGLIINQALDNGQVVLLEGAQATQLDVDHGTYPFVTSSSPTAGGACAGLGRGPDPDHQGGRDRQGLHDPGGRGPVPDRTDRRQRRVAAQERARVRRHDRAAAPHRLVRRGHRPVRLARQRHHRLLPVQARRAVRPGAGAGVRGLRGEREAV